MRAYATYGTSITTYGNEISFTATPQVGDTCLGGIVAYIFISGDPGYVAGQTHGLIVSQDALQTPSYPLATNTNTLYGTSKSMGSGLQNTKLIANSSGNNSAYAAQAALNYGGGGYSDWYLPSYNEANALIPYFHANNPNSTNNLYTDYWTSSEYSANFEYVLYLEWIGFESVVSNHYKSGSYPIRPIRTF